MKEGCGMDLQRLELRVDRITKSWISHSLLDRQIDRALLRDLLEALENTEQSERVNRLSDRVSALLDLITNSLTVNSNENVHHP
jgi:hypothetical protein